MFPYISVNGEKHFKWQTGTCLMKVIIWDMVLKKELCLQCKVWKRYNLCKASENKIQEIIEY